MTVNHTENMGPLPSPTQVAGNHNSAYESYYKLLDSKNTGQVSGLEAARFLKKSGLSDVILSRIWDFSDPGGKGYLDKTGVFVALKLVALVQNGRELSMNSINEEVPPPKLGDVCLPKPSKLPPSEISSLITSLPPSAVDWTIQPTEREKYDKLFDSLQPLNGRIPGNKGKNVLMESKLPLETLGKIWDLADQDKDGMLDRHEFVVAMHLVYKALEKYAIPNTLPPELVTSNMKANSTVKTSSLLKEIDGVKSEIPNVPLPNLPVKPVQSVLPTISWVVSAEEKAKSDALFIKSDIDKDGYVSGQEIKDVFLQSGVPQSTLAHIWALCDINQSGKLNNEQFALAMWFVARCLKGINPPPALMPEMLPPSFRNIKNLEGTMENNNTRYSNHELDMVSKDIEDLCKEKLVLEADIAQKEADVNIKNGEIHNLQSELNTLTATLKQLENQKGEAQKRLSDLKTQVEKLREQAGEQSELLEGQEAELNSKKEQLEGLKQEEKNLEQIKQENLLRLEQLTSNLQNAQLGISQIKALITQLQEQIRQITDAITACDSVIDKGDDATYIPDSYLRIKPDFRDHEYSRITSKNCDASVQNEFRNYSFSGKKEEISDDLFENDPFGDKDAFSSSNSNAAFPQAAVSFGTDPFDGSVVSNVQKDPFQSNAISSKSSQINTSEAGKDPFGCDPFAILHAPTRERTIPPRPSSPSPALPPKKNKQPPPRPAPPRPAAPPTKKMHAADMFDNNDPFEGSRSGFADFSNFDSKFASNPSHSLQSTIKGLDFTGDPFIDYKYEDPFNITFDDEDIPPENVKYSSDGAFGSGSNDELSSSNDYKSANAHDSIGLDGRQSAPLPCHNLSNIQNGRSSVPLCGKLLNSDDQQLIGSAREGLQYEEQHNIRLFQEQEQLQLAINLSKIAKNS